MFLYLSPAILNDARVLILNAGDDNRKFRSAVLLCISAVEAFLNDISQVGAGYIHHGHGTDNPMAALSLALQQAEKLRKPTQEKIMLALLALQGKPAEKGSEPFQSLTTVIQLRNRLAHPKSPTLKITSHGIEPPKADKALIEKLNKRGITDTGELKLFDIESLISTYECAAWAYETCTGVMSKIIEAIPYKTAVDSYKELFGLTIKCPAKA